MPALSIHHYNTAVHDLDQAVADFTARFGMQALGGRQQSAVGLFDYVSMGYGDTLITRLITPSTDDSSLHRLMRDRATPSNPHGEGMYLICYECDDVEAFCEQVEANGGDVTRVPGRSSAWIHPTSAYFVFMEIVQRRS